MAFFFSAVYSESLYLALSVGLFWCARQGRWAWVGVLGALAAATRSAGVVLLLPAADPLPVRPARGQAPDFLALPRWRRLATGCGGMSCGWDSCRPAWRCTWPTWRSGGDALMPFHAQDRLEQALRGPYVGVWDGIKAAFEGARQLLSFQRHHVYFPSAGGSPFVSAGHNLMLLAFLLAAVPAIVGVLRMLPLAYGVYVIAALALPLSYPVAPAAADVAAALSRCAVPAEHLARAVAGRAPACAYPRAGASGLLMAFFVAQFATWHWVA
jgi:hypothetical protein